MRAQLINCTPGQVGKLLVDFPAEAVEDNELHIHPISDRIITIISGSGEFIARRPGGEIIAIPLIPGHRVWMPRGVLHTFMAGKNGLLVESIHNPFVSFDDPRCLVYPRKGA
jgi:oxalate decarboxylase/phosphoglucose isomerase-like protein (cupin superfamily)